MNIECLEEATDYLDVEFQRHGSGVTSWCKGEITTTTTTVFITAPSIVNNSCHVQLYIINIKGQTQVFLLSPSTYWTQQAPSSTLVNLASAAAAAPRSHHQEVCIGWLPPSCRWCYCCCWPRCCPWLSSKTFFQMVKNLQWVQLMNHLIKIMKIVVCIYLGNMELKIL